MSAITQHPSRTGTLAPARRQLDADRNRAIPPVERDRHRDRRHSVIAVLGWLLAALGWIVALQGSSERQVVLALSVVGLSLLLTTGATVAWVAHNRRIHRRKGPRTGLPTARVEYSTDWVGRPVTTEWSLVQAAPEVVVSAGGGWKVLWPARPDSLPARSDR